MQDREDGSNAKLDELLSHLHSREVFVGMVVETWALGNQDRRELGEGGYLYLHHGMEEKGKGRGSKGVGMFLGLEAQKGYEKAGNQKLVFGERIMAIRIEIQDTHKKTVCLYVVVAYAPTSKAPVSVLEDYMTNLDLCVNECKKNEVLILGADVNASMGISGDHHWRDKVLGKWAGGDLNDRGKELHDFCVSNNLTAPLSFFQHKEYESWRHPRSGKGYRLDQWLIRKQDFKRVLDARIKRCIGVSSDHLPILLKVRVAARLAHTECSKAKLPIRRHLLRDAQTKEQFRMTVLNAFKEGPEMLDAAGSFEKVKAALQKGGEELRGREKDSPLWFQNAQTVLLPLIVKRQNAQQVLDSKPFCPLAKLERNNCNNKLKLEVRKAKHKWQAHRYDGLSDCRNPGSYWLHIKDLKDGLSSLKSDDNIPWFKNKAGVKSKTQMQNNAALKEHWTNLFNLPSTVDKTVMDKVRQRAIVVELGELPSDKEIINSTRKAKKGKAAGENKICIEFWQALLPDKSLEEASELELGCFALYRDVIHKCWRNIECPDDWLVGRLKMLYKGKGDRDVLDNWRGIMLLDVAAKVVCAIIADRLARHVAVLEEQNGFRAKRGTIDGLFGLKLVLTKRKEHGLSSWVVYVDLVKAFDSVPREGMYAMLGKLGVPQNLVEIIVKFHSNFMVKIKAGEVDTDVISNVGVKQGDSLAPVLFSLYFQACMEVLDEEWKFEKANFHYKMDDVLMSRKHNTKQFDVFSFYRSLYADDGAFLLTSRADLDEAVPAIFSVMKAFGLTMHVGRNGKPAKTEAVFYPSAEKARCPDPLDTCDIEVDGGIVSFTDKFKYLGSIIASNLRDDAECDARISAANKAFGALKRQLFNVRGIETRAKKHAYEALVLSLLFYGSECWVLSEKMAYKIKIFHRRCVRYICGMTISKMLIHNVHHADLENKMGLPDVFSILSARRLQWLGHTYRMPETRLPRRMLTAWVPIARPNGRPQLTYSHSIMRDLKKHGLEKGWGELASNRAEWRAMVKQVRKAPKGAQETPTEKKLKQSQNCI
jgi:exonuclease III